MNRGEISVITFIRATRSDVWNALTKPERIAEFHPAGMHVVALPEGGHELRRPGDGSVFLREGLVSEEYGVKLELTFEPSWAAVPEGGSTVSFEVLEEEDVCKVTFAQSNCAGLGIGDNWERFLSSMKSYLETGAGILIPPLRNG